MHRLFSDGLLATLRSLAPYAVIIVAVLGTLLAQSAYELAPLSVSFPPIAAAEPLAGIAIGVGVLNARLTVTLAGLCAQILGLMVMTAGIYALAGGPLHDRHHDRHRRSYAGPG